MGRCPAGKIRRAAARGRSPSSTMLASTSPFPCESAAAPRRSGPIASCLADETGTKIALLVMADTSPHVGRGRGRTAYARFLELLRGTGHRLGPADQRQPVPVDLCGPGFRGVVRMGERPLVRWRRRHRGTQRPAAVPFARVLKPVKSGVSGLLDAVEESRKRQADLSSVLRENVRQAVELLLEDVSTAHRTKPDLFASLVASGSERQLTDAEAHEALLQATVRIVMRLVVCLFAESRQLLPVNDPDLCPGLRRAGVVRTIGRGHPARRRHARSVQPPNRLASVDGLVPA